jgi:hypothetical protein
MKPNSAIQLKAVFLLLVFSLNTIVGFACAVGLNMGLNKKHHHHHETVSRSTVSHQHEKGTAHHHHHHEAQAKSKTTEEHNCCTDNATQLSGSDKLLTQTINSGIETPVTMVALHFLYSSHLSSFTQDTKRILVVRPYILSARGIRVSIQCFQI